MKQLLGLLLLVTVGALATPVQAAGMQNEVTERVRFVEGTSSSGPFETKVIDADGGNLATLERGGVVSPDGQWVAYVEGGAKKLKFAPFDGGTGTVLFDPPPGSSVGAVAWSPDSSRLAFEVEVDSPDPDHDDPTVDLWAVNLDGSQLLQLTNTPVAVESDPKWFPDASAVLFTYAPSPEATPETEELAVVDLAAPGSYVELTDTPDHTFWSSLLPVEFIDDGRSVVVTVVEVLDPDVPSYAPSDIWKIDVETGATSVLIGGQSSKDLRLRDVSPDGASILYSTCCEGSKLWLADHTGGNKEEFFPGAGFSAMFNHDASQVLINYADEGTDYLIVKEVDTGTTTQLASAPFICCAKWIPPGNLCLGLVATHVGTDGADVLTGTPQDDVIVSFAGNDTIDGRGGDDLICAGYGNDLLRGEAGHDTLRGGPGKDEIRGGPGNDSLWGESGNDSVYGGDGRDELRGGSGADELFGQGWRDRLYGDRGADTLEAGRGDDVAWGGKGDDIVRGWTGDDDLHGGGGDDTLSGGPDTDSVDGGGGTDTCSGEVVVDCP